VRVDDTFRFLLGEWALRRTIADHRDDRRGEFEGAATVRPSGSEGDRARYQETGRLRYGGYDGRAGRTLELLREGGAVLVNFSDGRPFFVLDLRDGSCHADHPCGADHHVLEFHVRSDSLLDERWHVHGPHTHYTARTRWERRDRGPAPAAQLRTR
jgi:hypothetical protein